MVKEPAGPMEAISIIEILPNNVAFLQENTKLPATKKLPDPGGYLLVNGVKYCESCTGKERQVDVTHNLTDGPNRHISF